MSTSSIAAVSSWSVIAWHSHANIHSDGKLAVELNNVNSVLGCQPTGMRYQYSVLHCTIARNENVTTTVWISVFELLFKLWDFDNFIPHSILTCYFDFFQEKKWFTCCSRFILRSTCVIQIYVIKIASVFCKFSLKRGGTFCEPSGNRLYGLMIGGGHIFAEWD